jgi:hypothetical protein
MFRYSRLIATLVAATATLTSSAYLVPRSSSYYGGYPFGGYPFGHHQNGPDGFFNSHGSSGSVSPPTTFTNADLVKLASLNWKKEIDARTAHAVLASVAFVFFFPMGAMAVRILPGRLAIIIHALAQVFAYILFTAAVGLGLWMAITIRFNGFNLVSILRQV